MPNSGLDQLNKGKCNKIYGAALSLLPELYHLVYWANEQSVSAVPKSCIKSPAPEAITIGTDCQIKDGTKLYSGRIAASG